MMNRWMKVALPLAVVVTVTGCAPSRLPAPDSLTAAEPIGQQTPVAAATGPDGYANVCHLKTSRSGLGGDGGDGSAVLYRGRYLITAAHNVYSPFYNRVTRIEVHCGARNVAGVTANFVLTDNEWASARGYFWKRYTHDLGVIRLPDSVVTAQAVELAGAVPAPGTTVEIAGYPGGTINRDNTNILYAGSGPVMAGGDNRMIGYRIDTTTGNSGGPVWQRNGDDQRLVGIHVVGYRHGGGARRVNDWFRRELARMINTLDRRAAE